MWYISWICVPYYYPSLTGDAQYRLTGIKVMIGIQSFKNMCWFPVLYKEETSNVGFPYSYHQKWQFSWKSVSYCCPSFIKPSSSTDPDRNGSNDRLQIIYQHVGSLHYCIQKTLQTWGFLIVTIKGNNLSQSCFLYIHTSDTVQQPTMTTQQLWWWQQWYKKTTKQ